MEAFSAVQFHVSRVPKHMKVFNCQLEYSKRAVEALSVLPLDHLSMIWIAHSPDTCDCLDATAHSTQYAYCHCVTLQFNAIANSVLIIEFMKQRCRLLVEITASTDSSSIFLHSDDPANWIRWNARLALVQVIIVARWRCSALQSLTSNSSSTELFLQYLQVNRTFGIHKLVLATSNCCRQSYNWWSNCITYTPTTTSNIEHLTFLHGRDFHARSVVTGSCCLLHCARTCFFLDQGWVHWELVVSHYYGQSVMIFESRLSARFSNNSWVLKSCLHVPNISIYRSHGSLWIDALRRCAHSWELGSPCWSYLFITIFVGKICYSFAGYRVIAHTTGWVGACPAIADKCQ